MERNMNRRELLIAAAALGAVAAAPGSLRFARAAEADKVAEAIAAITGGKTAQPGRVTLTAPAIAENGAVVPVSVEVASPMTQGEHVKSITIIADKNPQPRVISVNLTPDNGAAYLSVRMRLGETSPVRAFAVMSDGSVYAAEKSVKVTIGGCG